jgi:hypothetical protein
MSKRVSISIIILGILVIPFFMYKAYMLRDYHQYRGKVTGTEEVNVWQPSYKGSGGYYAKRYLPIIEYYKNRDTSGYVEGKQNYFYNLDEGDKVTVLELKKDRYKTTVYSFWLYWINAPQLIIILLVYGILLGFYYSFIYKNLKRKVQIFCCSCELLYIICWYTVVFV